MGRKSKTTVRRLPKRGRYDSRTLHAILDEGVVCHVGFAVDGQPYVLPMSYARDGERLFLHGSVASRLMGHLAESVEACVTVTLVDGLVLARSQFHHSMNYRSVVAFGRARAVREPEEKRIALRALVEHLVPGRGDDSRPPSPEELAATEVVEFPLHEASAKVREGPPGDATGDLGLDHWAGVIPLDQVAGSPVAAPDLKDDIPLPAYVRDYRRPIEDARQ
ncbi:MAG: pyridoxamine 5'-phosphate oxidase family protein [Acidobacteriota bacterium]|nr:pyridoxamine 5'-phosphate oxidase family protein [Acidobacteriota bacterium]